MSLWLCLRFDLLPLEALLKQHGYASDTATMVVAQRRVLVCDESASLAGVMPAQTVSTAQALLAHTKHRSLERDPESEDALLEQLTTWAYGLSPHLERWRDNALTIEIGSCLRLHQGLGPLLERVDTEMSLRGLTVSVGVAETRDAAWLLSHVEGDSARHPERPLTERLAPLPLQLIQADFSNIIKRLERSGIQRFGQLLDIPLPALGKRCGEAFVNWLNQVQGRQQEPAVTYQPPERFEDTLWFGFDIQNRQELHPAMQRLLAHFCQFLLNTQLGTSAIEWRYLRPQHLNTDTASSAPNASRPIHITARFTARGHCVQSVFRRRTTQCEALVRTVLFTTGHVVTAREYRRDLAGRRSTSGGGCRAAGFISYRGHDRIAA